MLKNLSQILIATVSVVLSMYTLFVFSITGNLQILILFPIAMLPLIYICYFAD